MMLVVGGNSTYNANSDCERVVEMGMQGYSKTEMAAGLNISTPTLYNWMKKNQAFKDAVELACTYSQAWWEKKGRDSLDKTHFQSAVYNRALMGRFPQDYGERVETTLKNYNSEPLILEALTPEQIKFEYDQILEGTKIE